MLSPDKKSLWLEGYENAYGNVQRLSAPEGRSADALNAVELLARVVDADCRAYSDKFGYHYDSRCLDHLSEALEFLVAAGAFELLSDEDEPRHGRRVRTRVVQGENLIAHRPTFDPLMHKALQEHQSMRERLQQLQAENELLKNPPHHVPFDARAQPSPGPSPSPTHDHTPD